MTRRRGRPPGTRSRMPLLARLQRAARRAAPLTLSSDDVAVVLPLLERSSRVEPIVEALRAAVERAGTGAGRRISGIDLDALEFALEFALVEVDADAD